MNNANKAEHRFFQATAVWYGLTIFWAFAPSFYLRKLIEDADPVPTHLIIHGIVFTIWISLYVVQVFLIRSSNYQLHKTLGVFGLIVMVAMVPTGMFPAIYKVYAGGTGITGGGHNVFRFLLCYFFFALAFYHRKKAFLHKRYMLACMVMLMGAAIFRIAMDLGLADNQLFYKGMQILPAMALFIFDLVKYRSVVLIDLASVAAVFGIFFLADYFWLSEVGGKTMDLLTIIFVRPFL